MCLARGRAHFYTEEGYCSFFKCLSSFGDILKGKIESFKPNCKSEFQMLVPSFFFFVGGGVGIFGGQVRISIIQSVLPRKDICLGRKFLKQEKAHFIV